MNQTKPTAPTDLAALLPGFDHRSMIAACNLAQYPMSVVGEEIANAVSKYLTPLVAALHEQLAAERQAREAADLALEAAVRTGKLFMQEREIAEAALRQAVEALTFYADSANWLATMESVANNLPVLSDAEVVDDDGRKARAALASPSAERAQAEAEVLRRALAFGDDFAAIAKRFPVPSQAMDLAAAVDRLRAEPTPPPPTQ